MNIQRKTLTPIVLFIVITSFLITFFTFYMFGGEYGQYLHVRNRPEFEGELPARFNFITNAILDYQGLLILLYLALSIKVALWCLKPKERNLHKFLWVIVGYLSLTFAINFHNLIMLYFFCFDIHHILGG